MTGWLSTALLGVAWTGSVTSAIYCGLVVTAAHRFRTRRLKSLAQPADFVPAISVLKPLHGSEPGLETNLRSFFAQAYPGSYELLFCARHAEDAGLAVARKLAAEYPHVPARILTCGEPQFPNPKMYSLAVMAAAAEHEILVTSDADARVDPCYLSRLALEMRDPEVSLAFNLYRAHTDVPEFHLYMDALGKSVEMNAGVLVADMFAGADFSLGVSVIQRREVFEAAGGFAELGSYWAEDFVLGNRLAAQGRGVRISPNAVQLIVTAESAAHSFRNQLRWAQSTRRSRPLGHLGTGLTFTAPFALLGAAVEIVHGHLFAAVLFVAAGFVNRAVLCAAVLRALGAGSVLRDALLYFLRDLYGFAIWACSYLPAETHYHGTQFRIMPDGRLLRPDDAVSG